VTWLDRLLSNLTYNKKVQPMKKINALLTTALFAITSTTIFAGVAILSPVTSAPAQAGWTDWVPVPSGVYLNIGREYFYGDYVDTGRPVFPGSVWEVKSGGRVIAHGYGNTPGWVWGLITKFFGPISVE
jgi:hypothetical protein